MEQASCKSEVARLLRQIEAECKAAQYGLNGFAAGTRHEAITARMEILGRLHEHLRAVIGDDATRLMIECLDQA